MSDRAASLYPCSHQSRGFQSASMFLHLIFHVYPVYGLHDQIEHKLLVEFNLAREYRDEDPSPTGEFDFMVY